ncbi:hypothetical protein [Aeromonas hydrophila]|uniref:hypothetical protein n=1 Tax=Aeromonas hydrophila TaxID=644 RepID=UPI00188E441E|nr:hypothetical protein [Aeromonas hydrophila]MBF4797909.1 hypothetical protein [Aeromonas hydrophila]
MQNYRVCFYPENSLDRFHQVFVRAHSQDSVTDKARRYFRKLGIPDEELLEYTVQCYGQGQIEFVDII